MKNTLLIGLLVLSLAANAAWFFGFQLRRPTPPPAAPLQVAAKLDPAKSAAALLALIDSGDTAKLKAAGLSAETVRSLALGRAFARLQARIRALQNPPPSDGKYWRRPGSAFSGDRSREQRAEMMQAQREFTEAMRDAFGDDATLFGGNDARYSFLPAAKRDQLRRIEQDYSELQQQIYLDTDGIQLPSDREKLKVLQAEKERDIAAMLTPEEREQVDLRTSSTAMNVRSRYGEVIQTEEEYKRIYALQKAFNDQYASEQQMFLEGGMAVSAETRKARMEAQRKLNDDVAAILGPEQSAALQRANDPDNRTLASLTRRLNLPESATNNVLATRESYAAESMRINADATLSVQERRTQLQGLAAKAATELQGVLGTEGADAYAQRASWLRMLKGGNAFSTNSKDAPAGFPASSGSVFPVPPPTRTNPSGG